MFGRPRAPFLLCIAAPFSAVRDWAILERMNAMDILLGDAALSKYGAHTALHCGDAGVSYAELAAGMRRAAGAWRTLGVEPGDRVMILLRDTPAFAQAWLGALWAGAVAIAVNGKLAAEDYRYMFEDSDARVFLAEEDFLAASSAIAGQRSLAFTAWRDALAGAAPMPHAAEMRPTDPAFWLYSSGTTGPPKGIAHAHRDVLPAGTGMREVLGLGERDTVFGTSKLFFAYGLEHSLLGPLALGASSVLCPEAPGIDDACRIVARHRPAAFFSVPSYYRRLLSLDREALAAFRGVRHCVAAGERLPAQILEQWRAATGREILCLYGTSETFCAAMMTPPGASSAARTGRPLTGVETRLLSADGAEPRVGEPGVLWLRHPSLCDGYVNRPEASRRQFAGGWYCTRDVFVRDSEGFFSHQGREDDFIKIAGQWVQPSELEDAVISATSIAEAACVRINDSDGFERLALYVTAGIDPHAAVRAATQACEHGLARHKRPKWIRAITELPRTATGKVQRYKLREILERELAGKE